MWTFNLWPGSEKGSKLLDLFSPQRRKSVANSIRRVAVYVLVSFALGCSSHKVSVEVGGPAPSISLTGATRDEVLRDPLRLESFRGQTIVLAFFYRARTPG